MSMPGPYPGAVGTISRVTTRRPRLGYALVATGALLFAVNAGVSRVAMGGDLGPWDLTTVRITGAAILFALLAAAFRRSALRPPHGRSLLLIAALGLAGVAGLQSTYNIAIDRLPLGVALLLEYLAPILVVLWVRLVRREPVHRRMWGAVVVSLAGLALVARVWDGLALDGLGVAMALAAAACFAAYFLLGERNVAGDDPLRVILWTFVVAAVVINVARPVWAVPPLTGTTTGLGRLDPVSVPLLGTLAWVVVLGTLAPFFLHLAALRHIPATVVTIVAMLEPVLATFLGWAWFRESLAPVQLAGVVAVLAGIAVAQSARRAAAALPPPQ